MLFSMRCVVSAAHNSDIALLCYAGKTIGQAVRFDTVRYGDGPEFKLGVPMVEEPSEEDIVLKEAEVQEQAALVRSLKEEQSLPNSSPAVVEAVKELLVRKEALVMLKAAVAFAMAGTAAEKEEDSLPVE